MKNVVSIIPTTEAKTAIKRINQQVRREVVNPSALERTPVRDMLERRSYMQSPEFWADPDNVKAWDLSKKVVEARDFASKVFKEDSLYQHLAKEGKVKQLPDGHIVECNPSIPYIRDHGIFAMSPDLSLENLRLFDTRAFLHNHSLHVKGEGIPYWCYEYKC